LTLSASTTRGQLVCYRVKSGHPFGPARLRLLTDTVEKGLALIGEQ